jgi:hypothetical protein
LAESSLMRGKTALGKRRGLIYLVRYILSLIFAGLLGTKQRTSAYICLSQSILRDRSVQARSIL